MLTIFTSCCLLLGICFRFWRYRRTDWLLNWLDLITHWLSLCCWWRTYCFDCLVLKIGQINGVISERARLVVFEHAWWNMLFYFLELLLRLPNQLGLGRSGHRFWHLDNLLLLQVDSWRRGILHGFYACCFRSYWSLLSRWGSCFLHCWLTLILNRYRVLYNKRFSLFWNGLSFLCLGLFLIIA